MAPGATLLYEGAKDNQNVNILERVTDVVDNHLASIISNSYGSRGENVGRRRSAEEAVYTAGHHRGDRRVLLLG